MNSNVRNAVLWLIVLCLVVLVWAVFRHPGPAGKTPQFSDLYREVTDGKVDRATFNSTTGDVTGKYKSGDDFKSTVPPAFTDFQKLMLDKGVTVSPGVIQGGTRSNVVPAECQVEVDVRAPSAAAQRYLERQLASLKPFDKRCTLEVAGGLNRPPMERSAGSRRLFQTARKLGAELGVTLEESSSGGGSDGNFTAALGIPTLDGLGAVGEGAHAPHESILIDRIADRTALLAKLVAAL